MRFQKATMRSGEVFSFHIVSSEQNWRTEHRHARDILGCPVPSGQHEAQQSCARTLLSGKDGGEVRHWVAINSCCSSTVGRRQPVSTETFAFRIITPGHEELTQMVSKFARKQYYNTQFGSSSSP